jgi:hypothetical protein
LTVACLKFAIFATFSRTAGAFWGFLQKRFLSFAIFAKKDLSLFLHTS